MKTPNSIEDLEQLLNFSRRSLVIAIENERGIGSDRLEIIFAKFPHWNPTWLFTGQGEMYLPTIETERQQRIAELQHTIEVMQKYTATQEKLIDSFQKEIFNCESQLRKTS